MEPVIEDFVNEPLYTLEEIRLAIRLARTIRKLEQEIIREDGLRGEEFVQEMRELRKGTGLAIDIAVDVE